MVVRRVPPAAQAGGRLHLYGHASLSYSGQNYLSHKFPNVFAGIFIPKIGVIFFPKSQIPLLPTHPKLHNGMVWYESVSSYFFLFSVFYMTVEPQHDIHES